jgi:hypothetical protein
MAIIHYQTGDIFESTAQVIVNTVNCKGVMGKGLALSFKQRYPAMFQVYQQECKTGKLRIGRPSLYKRSAPGGIRTHGQPLRRRLLYPLSYGRSKSLQSCAIIAIVLALCQVHLTTLSKRHIIPINPTS